MSEKINLIVNGACGKMGRQVITSAVQDGGFCLVGAIERKGTPLVGQDIGEALGLGLLGVKVIADLEKALARQTEGGRANAQVIIDFSTPESSLCILQAAERHDVALVVGTTGFTPDQDAQFEKLGKKIRCVKSPNMSVGVNLLFKLVQEAAGVLGMAYDIEIVEAHHRLKKDAPSGTAKKIAQIVASALGLNPAKDIVSGREGLTGERKKGEIGILAVRAGDIVGDHTVLFAGNGERLELIHRAHSRETFARGALRAAKFVVNAKPGLYTMQDVLGIQ